MIILLIVMKNIFITISILILANKKILYKNETLFSLFFTKKSSINILKILKQDLLIFCIPISIFFIQKSTFKVQGNELY